MALVAIYGFHGHRNTSYEPQNEFKLENWVNLGIFSINKAVLYLLLAAVLTCGTMIYVARRMQQRPNKVQTAVEVLFQLMHDNITGSAMDRRDGREVVPLHRHAVPLHPLLEPRRLHPLADEHRA